MKQNNLNQNYTRLSLFGIVAAAFFATGVMLAADEHAAHREAASSPKLVKVVRDASS